MQDESKVKGADTVTAGMRAGDVLSVRVFEPRDLHEQRRDRAAAVRVEPDQGGEHALARGV